MRQAGCISAVLLLIGSVSISGCDRVTGDNENTANAKREPRVLHLTTVSEPPSLDSAVTIDGDSFNVLNNVKEGLMRLNQDNRPEPAMAAGMPEVSADKKTYVFQIRKARWSDGRAVKARDFEYAWKRALDPSLESDASYSLLPLKNAKAYREGKASLDQVGVKAVGDRTLKVKLEEPTPYFLSLTASAAYLPQREDIVEKYGEQYAADEDKMVYNGPFVLSRWNRDQSFQYRKNDRYWDRNHVRLDRVHVKIVDDTTEAVHRYTSGRADVAPLSEDLIQAFKGSPEYVSVSRGATSLLIFNTEVDFLSNTKVRKALSLSIDRKKLVEEVLQNGSRPADGLVPDTILGYDQEPFREKASSELEYREEKAVELMEKGMEEMDFSSLPKLELNVSDDSQKKVALFLQEEWKDHLGLEVAINPQPIEKKLELEGGGQFQLSLLRWIGRYNDPLSFLEMGHSENEANFGGWKNSDFDTLIEQAKGNTDYQERSEDLVEAEKILTEKAGIAPLFYESQAYVQKPYVKHLYRFPIGAEYVLKWTDMEEKYKNSGG
ncbi:peptide ABC transporter substrate-binding protein [Paludifilum halophilum]|nr:peptide ABC transporter substrate-binding protein [Paludifilum halophilum]